MKKWMLVLLLSLCVAMVSACQPQTPPADADVSQPQGQVQESPLNIEAPVVEGLPEDYDPTVEEGEFVPLDDVPVDASGVALHAGATPMPLDPVDMPSPTPRPKLTFNFATYTATNLGITFESVAGYTVDDSNPDVYVLTEPAEQQKENYSVVFTFSRTAVTNTYSLSNLKTDLRNFSAELGQMNYQEWRVSNTAERSLLGKPGAYVTYRGVMHDGTIVRGRVHMALLDNNRVLTIHYTGPGEYNTDYSDVFTRIRSSLKAI